MICMWCGTTTIRNRDRYCSVICRQIYNFGDIRIRCETCGELIPRRNFKYDRRFCSRGCMKKGFTGEKNPFAGHTPSVEHREAIRQSNFARQVLNGNPFSGKSHSDESLTKMRSSRKDVSGPNNPNWKGGTSNPKWRYPWKYRKARGIVRIRDGFQCVHCGEDGSKSRLETHHRDGNIRNNSPSNLETCCARCHTGLFGRGFIRPTVIGG